MALSNDKNAAGNRYDALGRFYLLIKITKADGKGKILERMARGQCVGFARLEDALDAQDAFQADAELVLLSNLRFDRGGTDAFASYGMTCVIDEHDGCIHSIKHLGLQAQ